VFVRYGVVVVVFLLCGWFKTNWVFVFFVLWVLLCMCLNLSLLLLGVCVYYLLCSLWFSCLLVVVFVFSVLLLVVEFLVVVRLSGFLKCCFVFVGVFRYYATFLRLLRECRIQNILETKSNLYHFLSTSDAI
jgi:hypothetical protein